MSVVLDRPYQFVPPHRGDFIPSCIQTFRIVDRYLRRKEGVVSHESRNLDQFRQLLRQGDGILLAPNHCRYADPLVLGWPARDVRQHLYAMASWHLFNRGRLDAFAIRKMGGFSINREGVDRQSLELAIEILANAERPLILFAEGSTNRTNDVLKPLMDGVSFIARSAAKRRDKECGGRVVMLPIALKYLCKSDITPWANAQLSAMESHFGWRSRPDELIVRRTEMVEEGFLALKEIEYMGATQSGTLPERRSALIEHVLNHLQNRLGITPSSGDDARSRLRLVRSELVSKYFALADDAPERGELRQQVDEVELIVHLLSYPEHYLDHDQVTDTRVVETIQRIQEFHFGKADNSIPLHVVIQFGEAIPVPPERSSRGGADPIMVALRDQLSSMIEQLSREARRMPDVQRLTSKSFTTSLRT